jgi:hypothetical protein
MRRREFARLLVAPAIRVLPRLHHEYGWKRKHNLGAPTRVWLNAFDWQDNRPCGHRTISLVTSAFCTSRQAGDAWLMFGFGELHQRKKNSEENSEK